MKLRIVIFILFNLCCLVENIQSQDTTYVDTITKRVYRYGSFKQFKKESIKEFSLRIKLYKENNIPIGQLYIMSDKIPNTICRFKNSTFLGIQSMTKKMGNGVSCLINLRECDFYLEKLRKLPKYFGELKSMERIHLLSNLKRLPKNFFELQNLNYLELCAKRMRIISNDFEKLKNLELLSLDGNLKRIDIRFEKLEKLEDLQIYDYKGEIFPGYRELKNHKSNDTIFSYFPDRLNNLYLDIENVKYVPIQMFSKSINSIFLNNCFKLKSFIYQPQTTTETLVSKKVVNFLDVIKCYQLEDIEALTNLSIRKLSLIGLKPTNLKKIIPSLSKIDLLDEVTFSYSSFEDYKIPQELIDYALRHKFCKIVIIPDNEAGVEKEKNNIIIMTKFHKNIDEIKKLSDSNNIEVKYTKYDN